MSTQRINDHLSKLELVTENLDESFHRLLQEEEEINTELKQELKEDEKLVEITNKGLQAVDALKSLEKKLEQHETARDKGMSQEDMRDILGHDLSQIRNDIDNLKEVVDRLKQELQKFNSQTTATAKEVNTFVDIVGHLDDGENRLEELEERLESVSNSEYNS